MNKTDKMKQKVWAIPAPKLFANGEWRGLRQENLAWYLDLFRTQGEFRERGLLEEDPAYKQIIGQILFQVGDRFLLHQFTENATDARMHHLWPILVGGHIEEVDLAKTGDILANAMDREFAEETGYRGTIKKKTPLGVLYVENENPVNAVHVGLVFHYIGDTEDIAPTEDVNSDMHFATVDEILRHRDHLDYWSREVLPLLPRLVREPKV